jgi:hypothetical protein
MKTVTRHALRVYTALSGLKGTTDDVLDALIPFFEPILEVMNGRIFDPRLFAVGVQKLYRWRFTVDIAEYFIPRLVRKGYLIRRAGDDRKSAYIVQFVSQPSSTDSLPISELLNQIVDKFVEFSPRVTDLLHYSRTREELADILVRFLVSLDAYSEASFVAEIKRLQLGIAETSTLAGIEEGGTPLAHDDRYMCARFVKYISVEYPEYITHLARLASIGLLTEVVEDFARPIQSEDKTDLTVVVLTNP